MCSKIIEDLCALKINGQSTTLATCRPYSDIIIKSLAENDEIVVADLMNGREGSDHEDFESAIQRANGSFMNFYELLRTPLLSSIEPIIMHVVVHVGTYIYI